LRFCGPVSGAQGPGSDAGQKKGEHQKKKSKIDPPTQTKITAVDPTDGGGVSGHFLNSNESSEHEDSDAYHAILQKKISY